MSKHTIQEKTEALKKVLKTAKKFIQHDSEKKDSEKADNLIKGIK